MHPQYILIDYENVQPEPMAELEAEPFKVMVFVGATQKKVPIEVAAAFQRLGSRAQYIRIDGTGPNALDFHIAFHLGVLAQQDPTAYYFVVSKDSGFDPLIRHINSRKTFACRVKDLLEVPPIRAARAKTAPERASVVASHLAQRAQMRPRTLKALAGTVRSLFLKELTDSDVSSVIRTLQSRGVLDVQEDRVTYTVRRSEA